jgi:hypothetical protein
MDRLGALDEVVLAGLDALAVGLDQREERVDGRIEQCISTRGRS